MAQQPGNLPSGITSSKLKELRQRILFVLGAFLVYRIGVHITVPGINKEQFAKFYDLQKEGVIGLFNTFSGGAFEGFSLFAIGIMPYISAAIIIQLLSHILPSLQQLRKEGETGRRKITKYTRYATVVLATIQGVGVSIALQSQENLTLFKGFPFIFTATVTLVTGTMFLMWLGEQITERGIGNGISLLIFAGIVAGLPEGVRNFVKQLGQDDSWFFGMIVFMLVLAVTAFVVFVERGQRRIKVDYAKRQQGRRMYSPPSSYLPLKLNMAGVIPPIFASSLVLFPATISKWVSVKAGEESWVKTAAKMLEPSEPLFMIIFGGMIVFFCFFYTALVFNSRETADNLKKSGAFIPGIRPGEQTSRYVDSVLTRLTAAGAVYLTAVCLLPEIMKANWAVPFYFGGTSLLIIVVVVMDFMAQMQAHLLSHQYESLMKKSNFKGFDNNKA